MSTPILHRAATASDKAEILALIDSRPSRPSESDCVELQSRDLTIWMNGNSAVSEGLVRWSRSGAERQDASPFWIRETICLERKPDGWRVVREQTSAPFRMDRAHSHDSRLRIGWASVELPEPPCC